jgi:inner membrane protein
MGTLAVGLLVPLTWVYSIVRERAARREEAVREVSSTWGGPQTLSGPVLSIPYVYSWMDGQGRRQEATAYAHALPRELQIDTELLTERRRRGIFEVVVYRSQLIVRGRFRHAPLDWVRPVPERVDWTGAVLSVGLTDPRGLSRRAVLTWNGRETPFTSGVAQVGLFNAGIQARLPELAAPESGTEIPFSFNLAMNGTRQLRFLPSAEETTATVKAGWAHPSFVGGPLPERWSQTSAGFEARWQVPDFGRSYAGRWSSADIKGEELAERARGSAFGVDLIQPVDIYHQAERAVKYAILFIALTFVVFFLWEIFQTTLLHPVQYAFVGFALCVFYLLLISISEHAGFDLAYGVSSVVITLLIGGYSRAVLRGTRQAGSVACSLCALYGFLYLLLRLEDYALLAGAAGLVVVLAFLMFVTRGMDWYELRLGSVEVSDAGGASRSGRPA